MKRIIPPSPTSATTPCGGSSCGVPNAGGGGASCHTTNPLQNLSYFLFDTRHGRAACRLQLTSAGTPCATINGEPRSACMSHVKHVPLALRGVTRKVIVLVDAKDVSQVEVTPATEWPDWCWMGLLMTGPAKKAIHDCTPIPASRCTCTNTSRAAAAVTLRSP